MPHPIDFNPVSHQASLNTKSFDSVIDAAASELHLYINPTIVAATKLNTNISKESKIDRFELTYPILPVNKFASSRITEINPKLNNNDPTILSEQFK